MLSKPTLAALVAGLAVAPGLSAQDAIPQTGNAWYTEAQAVLDARVARRPNTDTAKNVILFVADGNGVGTNYATRLWQGQQAGNHGDEQIMAKEALPYLALVKTYNVNAQTPDSAGTATAMFSGVKTKAGVIGVDETVNRGDCSQVEAGKVTPFTKIMSDAGKSTGIVSTARVTHATPASAYAHSADRGFEDDSELPEGCEVPDIALQMVDVVNSGMVDLVMGGGRRHFLPEDVTDDEGNNGRRTDGRNLIQEMENAGVRYVWNDATFKALDRSSNEPIVGLFESSHMQYEHDRTDEPSLAQMVETAINVLSGNDKGFFLAVEGGRVDHGNHDGNLHRTVTDGVAFDDAVARAMEMTDPADTLVIVTADHEHAIAFMGYCGRGTPITGLCYGIDDAGLEHTDELQLGDDGQPYAVVGFLNGPGSIVHKEAVAKGETPLAGLDVTREINEDTGAEETFQWMGSRGAVTQEQATDPDYLQQALVPKSSESHSGEDVAAYASGPWAHLVDGTIEQNYLFHVMLKATSGN